MSSKSESKAKMSELISELIKLMPDASFNRSINSDWWLSGDNNALELENGVIVNFRNDNRIEISISKDEDMLSLYRDSLSQLNNNLFNR